MGQFDDIVDGTFQKGLELGRESIKLFTQGLEAAGKSADEHRDQIAGLGAAYATLYATQELMANNLYKSLVGTSIEVSQIPRQLASEIVGSSIFLSENMANATDKMTQNALAIQRAAYADQQELAERQIKVGETIAGVDITLPVTAYFENASELGKAFYEGAMADTRLFNAAVEASTTLSQDQLYRMKETSALAMKGLGLDITTMNALYQEEFSKTGKISGEMVDKFSATVLAAAKETGLGTDQVAEDMMRMIKDVEKFGNMSYAQMTSLSSAIHQLGLDMEDVVAVTSKLTSFENASQAIANIGAVTGATLDTMELFYLANEDKEEFFRTMRQSLLDQGVTLENLSHQEQVYLSKQLGFNSVRQLQSLLNEEIDFTTGNITDKIEEAASSQDYVGDKLSEQLAKTGGLAKETLDAMKPENMAKMLDAAKNLTQGTSKVADAANTLNTAILDMTKEAIPGIRTAATSLSDGIAVSVDSAIKKLNEFRDKVEALVKKEIPAALAPATPRSVPEIWQPFDNGLKVMRESADITMSGLSDDTRKNLMKAGTEAAASMELSIKSAAARFDVLRDLHKDKAKEINKIESDLAKDVTARLNEATKVEEMFKNQIGLTSGARAERIQEKYGGEGRALSDADVDGIIKAIESGNSGAIRDVIVGKLDERITAATAGLGSPAATATPAEPGSRVPVSETPEAGAAPEATPTARPAAATGASPAGDLSIKVKLDFDTSELADLITTKILPDAISGGIDLPARGDRVAARYTFQMIDMR